MRFYVINVHRANKLFFFFLSLVFALIYARLFPVFEEYFYYLSIPASSEYVTDPNSVFNIENYPIPQSGYFIKIDLDALLLEVYKDGGLINSFPVSGGRPDWPSPTGIWKVTAESNWGSGFGGSWMSLNVPWGRYGIHGTLQPWYVGRENCSHGCIRLKSRDAVKLRKLIPVGTKVLIIQENAPFRTLSAGKFGSDVFKLQVSLGITGFYNGSMDGRFGEGTKKSVISFQEHYGLNVTGEADKKTYSLALSLALD